MSLLLLLPRLVALLMYAYLLSLFHFFMFWFSFNIWFFFYLLILVLIKWVFLFFYDFKWVCFNFLNGSFFLFFFPLIFNVGFVFLQKLNIFWVIPFNFCWWVLLFLIDFNWVSFNSVIISFSLLIFNVNIVCYFLFLIFEGC